MAKEDGGPAFTVGSDLGPASNICDGGYGGMTLRDYFAAKAMQSELIANNGCENEKIASWAYAMADAMLAERSK